MDLPILKLFLFRGGMGQYKLSLTEVLFDIIRHEISHQGGYLKRAHKNIV